jgi:hypothetical protein
MLKYLSQSAYHDTLPCVFVDHCPVDGDLKRLVGGAL